MIIAVGDDLTYFLNTINYIFIFTLFNGYNITHTSNSFISDHACMRM